MMLWLQRLPNFTTAIFHKTHLHLHVFEGIVYRSARNAIKKAEKAKSNLQMRSVNTRKGLNNEVLKSMVSAKTKFMCICFSVNVQM